MLVCALHILGGWSAAAAAAVTFASRQLMDGNALYLAVYLAVVIAGVERFRRGASLLVVAPLLTVVGFALRVLLGAGTSLTEQGIALAISAVEVDLTLTLAVLVQAAARRWRRVVPVARRTIRLDDVLFAIGVGSAAAAVAGLYLEPASGIMTLRDEAGWRAAALLALVHVICSILALRGGAAVRRLRRPIVTPGRSPGSPRPYRGWPAEIARLLIQHRRAVAGRSRRVFALEQRLDASQRQIESLQRQLHRTKKESGAARRSLEHLRRIAKTILASWKATMDLFPGVTILVDAHGRIGHVRGPTGKLLGYELKQLRGRPISALVPSSCTLAHPLELDEREPVTSTPQPVEAPIRTRSGQTPRFSIASTSFLLRGGRHRIVQLQPASRRDESSDTSDDAARRVQNRLIASMSHELRTPLHGLIATLDMLRDEALSAQGRRQLAVARSSARSLLKIADDVLDLARLSNGTFPLERRQFDLRRTLGEVVEENRARAEASNLRLSIHGGEELPPSFFGDPQRIKQVLVNLVYNAIKFTPAGEISLRVHYDGAVVVVDVSDTGPGIPPEKRETIFEPFVQGDPSSRGPGGAGLGLAISRQLSEAMGGRLELVSSGPKGSTFRMTLPLESSPDVLVVEQTQRNFCNPQGRILVVEDHRANQYVVQSLLTSLSCPSTLAASGSEALEAIASEEFDLILMDCQMPGMDGLETTRRARRLLKRHVPIIAMTANASSEYRQRCLEAGMDDFLAKPFGRPTLHAILCKWLQPSKGREPLPVVTERVATLQALDPKTFDALAGSLHNPKSALQEIKQSFLETARKAQRLPGNVDSQEWRRFLHTLSGTAGMIGARHIRYLAEKMREASSDDDRARLASIQAQLRDAIRDFEQAFDTYLAGSPS